jgi:hypothetical protein
MTSKEKKELSSELLDAISDRMVENIEYLEDRTIRLYYQIVSQGEFDIKYVKSLFDNFRTELISEQCDLVCLAVEEAVKNAESKQG